MTPEGWTQARLGDVTDVAIGGTPSRSAPELWDPERRQGYRWVAISDLKGRIVADTAEYISALGVQRSNVKRVPAGTPIMSFKLSIGRIALAGCDLYTNEAIAAFHRKGPVEPDYLLYALPRSAEEHGEADVAVKGKTLNKAKLIELPLLLPPLGEQRKIAAILSSVDDAIEATQAVIDQLQVVKKAMMAELLTRGLPGRHTRFKMTEIGEVPEEWEVVRLGDAADVVRGSTPRPARDPRFFGGNAVPWITVGELSKEDWPYLSETATGLTEEGKARSRFLERGTLVLSNSGFGCGVPKILQLDGCANDGIAAFLKLQRFRPLFLYYVLASLTEHLRGSVARGVEQPNLNTTLIGDLRIVAPSEREQAEISDVLFGLDERVARERATMKAGRDLKVALTRVLLTGEVRVKPDEGAA